ncbi:MAG: hypothetical protein ABI370_11595 [Gammaproteobacteria bacterium]
MTHQEVLGVDPTASKKQILSAIREKLIKTLGIDTNPMLEEILEKMQAMLLEPSHPSYSVVLQIVSACHALSSYEEFVHYLFSSYEKNIKYLPYTDNFSHLDGESLKEKIHNAELHYQFLQDEKTSRVTQKAFLWKAEKKGRPDIYIFNTMHGPAFDVENIFGDALDNILNKVAVVYTEIQGFQSSPINSDQSLDEIIAIKAASMGKKLKALEDEKIRNLTGCKPSETILDYTERKAEIKKVGLQYLTHISPPEMNLEKNSSTAKRNMFWVMESLLIEESTCLVAFGATHSSSKWGVPNLLAVEGYTLTPLMIITPTSRSEMVHRLFYHDDNVFSADKNKLQKGLLHQPQYRHK